MASKVTKGDLFLGCTDQWNNPPLSDAHPSVFFESLLKRLSAFPTYQLDPFDLLFDSDSPNLFTTIRTKEFAHLKWGEGRIRISFVDCQTFEFEFVTF